MKEKLKQVAQLEKDGKVDDAIDIVFGWIDDLLLDGQFIEVDEILKSVDTVGVSTDTLLTLLTVTLAASHKLVHRRDFFRKVRRVLNDRKHNERGLLDGLE
jgi:hypothetical protein